LNIGLVSLSRYLPSTITFAPGTPSKPTENANFSSLRPPAKLLLNLTFYFFFFNPLRISIVL
jgi:hypothetical protein